LLPGTVFFGPKAVITTNPGDHNGDGKVDAADYVMWRNDPDSHGGNPTGYNTWRANFGAGSGAGSSVEMAVNATPTPEPSAILLAALAFLGFGNVRLRCRG
jgi:hypothetical protein